MCPSRVNTISLHPSFICPVLLCSSPLFDIPPLGVIKRNSKYVCVPTSPPTSIILNWPRAKISSLRICLKSLNHQEIAFMDLWDIVLESGHKSAYWCDFKCRPWAKNSSPNTSDLYIWVQSFHTLQNCCNRGGNTIFKYMNFFVVPFKIKGHSKMCSFLTAQCHRCHKFWGSVQLAC